MVKINFPISTNRMPQEEMGAGCGRRHDRKGSSRRRLTGLKEVARIFRHDKGQYLKKIITKKL